jgi:hypothetical protein
MKIGIPCFSHIVICLLSNKEGEKNEKEENDIFFMVKEENDILFGRILKAIVP